MCNKHFPRACYGLGLSNIISHLTLATGKGGNRMEYSSKEELKAWENGMKYPRSHSKWQPRFTLGWDLMFFPQTLLLLSEHIWCLSLIPRTSEILIISYFWWAKGGCLRLTLIFPYLLVILCMIWKMADSFLNPGREARCGYVCVCVCVWGGEQFFSAETLTEGKKSTSL